MLANVAIFSQVPFQQRILIQRPFLSEQTDIIGENNHKIITRINLSLEILVVNNSANIFNVDF